MSKGLLNSCSSVDTRGTAFQQKIALYEQPIKEHLEVMMRLSEAFSILAATILGVREASR